MVRLNHAPAAVTYDGTLFAEHAARADEALLGALHERAGQYLEGPYLAAVNRKTRAVSGNPHDYCSMGPYWWPNPATPDGLPYIRRDGEVNPERHERDNIDAVFGVVETLALAAVYENDPAYAERAAGYLRTWFLDEATAMTPHLRYAQMIPGVCDGRGIGLIDTHLSYRLFNALALLEAAGMIPEDVLTGVKAWFDAFLNWMLTAETAIDEDRARNNHGTWYDVQVAATAAFLGRKSLCARTLETAWDRRVLKQIRPDGSQPLELARTNALGYSVMNLHAFCLLARMAKLHTDKLDYWHTPSPDGSLPLLAALKYVLPYADTLEGFPYQQISGKPPRDAIAQLLTIMGPEYPEENFTERAQTMLKPSMTWRLTP